MPQFTFDEGRSQYHTEHLAEGVRFVLPRRPGGGGGICLILFGMLFSGFAVFWILGATGLLDPILDKFSGRPDAPTELTSPAVDPPSENKGPGDGQPAPPKAKGGFDPCRLAFGLFGLPFFLVGLVPIAAGIMSLFGHTEIEITGDALCNIDRAGPLRKRRCRSLRQLLSLEVGRVKRTDTEREMKRRKPMPLPNVNAITAQFTSEEPLAIASGYPIVLLRRLADDLANEHQRMAGGKGIEVTEAHDHPAEDEVDAAYSPADHPEEVPPQPAGSTAILEAATGGLTLRVPPTGLRKAVMAPVIFGIFWCVFVAFFTAGMVAAGVPWPMYLFISIFWIVGILLLLTALNMTRRQAVIDVVHDTLLVTRQSIFGRKQHEWRAEDLYDIRVDHSGMSVNDKPDHEPAGRAARRQDGGPVRRPRGCGAGMDCGKPAPSHGAATAAVNGSRPEGFAARPRRLNRPTHTTDTIDIIVAHGRAVSAVPWRARCVSHFWSGLARSHGSTCSLVATPQAARQRTGLRRDRGDRDDCCDGGAGHDHRAR